MARPLRIEYPGALYHVTSRGNARQRIFKTDKDRNYFIELLGDISDRFRWLCYAYCLMDNHYHLVIQTQGANLAKGMRQLNGIYTQKYNWRYRKTGHVFQGRYKAIIVDRDAYLLELCRYVVLNPVRAHAVEKPEDWKWSSYRATAGIDDAPSLLSVEALLGHFSKKRKKARLLYRKFVSEGISGPSLWEELTGQIYLGDKQFIESAKGLARNYSDPEIPRQQREAARPDLSLLFAEPHSKKERNKAIYTAHIDHGYTLKEIGDHVGLHYASISRIIVNEGHKKMLKYKT